MLEHLVCPDNKIVALDVSYNPALEYLNCAGNYISAIDLGSNPKLNYITCDFLIIILDKAYDFNLTDFMAAYHLDGIFDSTFRLSTYCYNGDGRTPTTIETSYNSVSSDYELASIYISQGKTILHFPDPEEVTQISDLNTPTAQEQK